MRLKSDEGATCLFASFFDASKQRLTKALLF